MVAIAETTSAVPRVTKEQMRRKASWQLGGDLDGILFTSKSFYLRVWLTLHLDLMAAGLLDFFDFVWHAVEIFCLNTQTALPLHILPRDRPPQAGKRD